jgi:hypothetical protein
MTIANLGLEDRRKDRCLVLSGCPLCPILSNEIHHENYHKMQ